jgi:Putative Actinobacterial Holin-X, holin superfamily III
VDPVSPSDPDIPPPIGDLLRQLVADGIAWFEAEREVYGVQARITQRAAGWIAGSAFAALIVAQGAMIALVVGILMVLGPMIGSGWATIVVVLVCTVIVGLSIIVIRSKLRSIKASWKARHDG